MSGYTGTVCAPIFESLKLSIFAHRITNFGGAIPSSIGVAGAGVASIASILSRAFSTGFRSLITRADVATVFVLLIAVFTCLSAFIDDCCVTCGTGSARAEPFAACLTEALRGVTCAACV